MVEIDEQELRLKQFWKLRPERSMQIRTPLVLKSARGDGDRSSTKASYRGGIRRLDLNLGQFMPNESLESQANQTAEILSAK